MTYYKRGLDAKRKHGRKMFVVSELASSKLNLSFSSLLQVLLASPEKLWPRYSMALSRSLQQPQDSLRPPTGNQKSPRQRLWYQNVQDLGPKGVTTLPGHDDMYCVSWSPLQHPLKATARLVWLKSFRYTAETPILGCEFDCSQKFRDFGVW